MIEEAERLVGEGMVPGGSRNNEALVADICDWSPELSSVARALLCDAQTSGGLLITLRADQAEALVMALHADDCPEAAIIGSALKPSGGETRIFVEP
jgi:selenide,water dikinase